VSERGLIVLTVCIKGRAYVACAIKCVNAIFGHGGHLSMRFEGVAHVVRLLQGLSDELYPNLAASWLDILDRKGI
jgi:hypothetical protein